MKKIVVWFVSTLLIVQPAVFAAGKTNMTELKSLIEYSEVTKRSMTFKELYGKSVAFLPKKSRMQIEPLLAEYGDVVLPKFSVSKIKNSKGNDFYQLSAVQNGKSITLALGDSHNTSIKINGKEISESDFSDFKSLLQKSGMTNAELKNVPASRRQPAQVYILNSAEIQKLNKSQQRTYFKQLRGLLESMEAVDKAIIQKSSRDSASNNGSSPNRKPASAMPLMGLMMGPEAFAGGVEQACVAAGYVTNTGKNPQKNNRITCGSDGLGNVQSELRGNCKSNQFLCNPAVYGPNGGCVDASRETTKVCNQNVSGQDIPDLNSENKQKFEELRSSAMTYSEQVMQVCGESTKGILSADQMETCTNFQDRKNVIESWDCANPDFSSKYPKLCSGANQPGPGDGGGAGNGGAGGDQPGLPGTPSGPGTGGPGADVPSGPGGSGGDDSYVRCESLPNDMTFKVDLGCQNGSMFRSSCTDRSGNAQVAYQCSCDDGNPVVGKLKCGAFGQDGSGKDKKKVKKKRNGPNWLLIGGAGLVGLLAFHWLNKKAVKQQYKNIDPLPQNQPVPVDPVAPPGAR